MSNFESGLKLEFKPEREGTKKEHTPEREERKRIGEKLRSARARVAAFVKERTPSKEQIILALTAGIVLFTQGNRIDAELGKAGLEHAEEQIDELSEEEFAQLQKDAKRLVDARVVNPEDLKNATLTYGEVERETFTPHVGIIDIAPLKGQTDIQKISEGISIAQEQFVKEFRQDFDKKWDTFIKGYLGHGEEVRRVMEETWRKTGLESTNVEISALQRIIEETSVQEVQDFLGNSGISLNFDSKRIIDLLKDNPNQIINLSFQIGNVEIYVQKWKKITPEAEFLTGHGFYDENDNFYKNAVSVHVAKDGAKLYFDAHGNQVPPITPQEFQELEKKRQEEAERNSKIVAIEKPVIVIVGAYTREKAPENLPKLFELCRAYPHKLFIVAAGNNGEDLRDALDKLSEKRPDNLVIVAEWARVEYEGNKEGFPVGDVRGADLYVPNKDFGAPPGSSFSTPVIAAYAEILRRQGLSIKEIGDRIRSACPLKDVGGALCVFDPQQVELLKEVDSKRLGAKYTAMAREIVEQKKQKAGRENFMKKSYERKHKKQK